MMQKIFYFFILLILATSCRNVFDEKIQAEANYEKELGSKLYNEENYDSAIIYFRSALQLYGKLTDTVSLGNIHHNIGMSFNEQNKYDSALFHYHVAMVYFIKTEQNLSNTFKMIGHIHDRYNNYDYALKYYQQSLETLDTIADPDEKYYLYSDFGSVYKSKMMYDSSLHYYQKMLQSSEIDPFMNANIGITYDSLKQTDRALFYYHLSLDSLNAETENKNINLIASVMASLGTLFIKQNNLDSATYYKNSIDNILNYVSDKEYQIEIWKMYSSYYELIGDETKAIYYFKKYTQAWLELYNENRTIGYSIMQVELNLAENEQLRLKAEQSEQITKYISIFSLIILTFVFGITALLLYSGYKRRMQKQKYEFELEKKAATERTIFDGEEKAKYDLSDYIHASLAGEVRSVSEIIKNSPLAEQQKTDLLERIDQVLKKVRNISHELGPASLKTGGLKDAIFDMCSEMQSIFHLKVNHICKVEKRFDATFELKVYRIIQDLKNNIIAHARATESDIQILQSDNNLSITVEDNGIGFDINDLKKSKGIGIRNIEAKVQNLNGVVEFNSQVGEGTCALIEIPIVYRNLNELQIN